VSSATPLEAESLRRIANLLALHLVKDMPKTDQAVALTLCGFTSKEIALLIGTSDNAVRALVSQRKRGSASAAKSG